ncbi:MAG: acyl-CoA dehydrogenase family protein [Hyphomicrobiaceae bacterium]|nr:acyl-CoA dehydrogenase family protein [Hyphomicrobiaceae bacterium]
MDLELTEEQLLLKDSVNGLLARRYPDVVKTRVEMMKEPKGYSEAGWMELAGQGLTAIPFAEADGGLGQGPVEMMLVGEAVGRTLALEPFYATVVLGGGIVRHAANAEQRAHLVPEIAAGTLTLALAHQEKQSRFDLFDVATTAKPDASGGYVLEGEKMVVVNGDSADRLIVTARVAGDRRAKEGIGLFLVDGKAAGLSRRGYPTQDGGRAADISLSSVKVAKQDVLGEPGKGLKALERTVDEAIAYLAAEAVGAMEVLHEATLDYVKTRKQFGVAIGSFQVIQHRLVDIFTALEQSRSIAIYGSMMAGEDNAIERRRAMHAVKVQIGKGGRHIGQDAIQLHGGIGMTTEYKASHYFKRLTMIDLAFGNADHHLRELARLGGLIEASKPAA